MTIDRLPPTAPTSGAIATVVEHFYNAIRDDDVLGPMFARHVDDWPPHLQRMQVFWRSVLQGTAEFKRSPRGAPPDLHAAIDGLQPSHFARWLRVFEATVAEVLPGATGEAWVERAHSIADILMRRAC